MDNKQPLTSAEIANLWYMFMHDTMVVTFKKYSIAKAEDKEIRAILEKALNISDKRSKAIASIFENDELPVPIGYNDKDVNIDAPRLYSDAFTLYHVLTRTRWFLTTAATSLFLAVRPDVRKLFHDAIASSDKLNEDATQVALSKGLLLHSPVVSIPEEPHFVERQSYLGSLIGPRRPLHISSLTDLFLSIQENIFGKVLITGFSQVAGDIEVKKYFIRGLEIGSKHIKIYSSLLKDEDIPIPESPDIMVTNSTIPPFSDRFMLNHILTANNIGIADIGLAIGKSNRADIAADYTRLMAEVFKYGDDGMNLVIKKGWMEAPPQVVNHKELAASGKTV